MFSLEIRRSNFDFFNASAGSVLACRLLCQSWTMPGWMLSWQSMQDWVASLMVWAKLVLAIENKNIQITVINLIVLSFPF
jgi:hypothetical protein